MWRQNLGSEPCKLLQQLCLQDDIIHILVTFMARLAVALHKLGKFCVRRSLKFNQCGVQRRTWGGEEVHSKWICNNTVWRVEVYTSSYRLQMQHLPVTLHPDSWKIFFNQNKRSSYYTFCSCCGCQMRMKMPFKAETLYSLSTHRFLQKNVFDR